MKGKEKVSIPTEEGWAGIKEKAKEWAKVNLSYFGTLFRLTSVCETVRWVNLPFD